VQFTDKSTNTPTSWAWSFGDGGTSTAKNPSHTYTKEGTYTVKLTVSNKCGSDTEIKDNYITVSSDCLKGDIDGNGVVLINDAVLLLKHIANPIGNPFDERQKCAGDMDGNGVILINDAVLLLKKIAGITSIVYSHLSSDTGAAHISSDTEAAHISFDTEAKIFISEFKTREGSKVKLTANAAAGVSLNLSYQDANLLDIKTFGISAIHQDGDAIQIVWLNTNEDGNIVELEFEGNPILNVADVVVSDSSGNLISAQIIYNPMVEDTILLANYPNPFNPETWIPFQLKESSDVAITIYDQMGHLIKRINLGKKEAGRYVKKGDAVYWDGKNENGESVAGGLYFYTITAGNFKATRKMIVIK
jgi:PKD repeat protein